MKVDFDSKYLYVNNSVFFKKFFDGDRTIKILKESIKDKNDSAGREKVIYSINKNTVIS